MRDEEIGGGCDELTAVYTKTIGNENAMENAYLSCHYVISLQVRDRPSKHLFRRNE